MRRPTLNFVVDAVAFAAFALLTATGVLMRYTLPPGSGHSTTVWHLDRHDWGAIHFAIAAFFLAALAAHLVLHWRWIANAIRGRPREGSAWRMALGAIGLLALLALAAAPLLAPVEQREPLGRGPAPHGAAGMPR